MHRLLRRQLKKFLADEEKKSQLTLFLDAVNAAYEANDKDISIIERSLDLTSKELTQRNNSLRMEVNKQAQIQKTLNHSLSALNATFDATGEAIFVVDINGFIGKTNKMADEFIVESNIDFVDLSVLKFKSLFAHLVNPSTFLETLQSIEKSSHNDLCGQVKFEDNRSFEYHCSVQFVDNVIVGRVWCFRDISEFKKNEALLAHQAYHDALTGLPNRALLNDRLNHAVSQSKRFATQLVMMFVDLDDFKKINDNAGHEAGDEVLIEVTKRVACCIREMDTQARLGGDEFVILVENISDTAVASDIAIRIIDSLSKPFKIEGKTYFISSSIGMSVYPNDGDNTDELLRKADMAMYHAKSLGKGNFQYFKNELDDKSNRRLHIENMLRKAIKNNEFFLEYQPKIDLKTNKIAAVEALIRWKPADGSEIAPDEFIAIAEQTGVIDEIGQWVVNEACKMARSLLDRGVNSVPIAVNVSPIEFKNKRLALQFKNILDLYELPRHSIEVEITESLFFENIQHAKLMLNKLRTLGIKVAVDDFGVGYSSLQYLHRLPIDIIKIDRMFITALDQHAHDAAIADAVITLAHNLRLQVVAEGVEKKEVLDFLIERNCDYAQGYYFHQPVTDKHLFTLIEAQHHITD